MSSPVAQSSPAGAASLTRLPPSPETALMAPATPSSPGNLSLDDTTNVRLRSVARYSSFYPQAIACSNPLYGCSVGACAGPHGVALFRVSRPHTPLVVLSHASPKHNPAGSISALSFQPHTKDSLLLAAARGSGVLIWDASGHSLSPLLGRLAMEQSLLSTDRITSISWKPSSTQSLLATTNATNACLWDLRTSLRGTNPSRPSVRLGAARKVGNDGKVMYPLVQIAASDKEQVATLDARGTVHVFDVRMTERSSKSLGAVALFPAFDHKGIGLDFLPNSKEDTCWITWGLDMPQSDAIVKVWSDSRDHQRRASDSDSYWFMDGSPESSPKPKNPLKTIDPRLEAAKQYHPVAEFSTPYMACARVSPQPFENQVVTVGMVPGKGERASGWRAEVWQLTDVAEKRDVDEVHYGAEKMLSFAVSQDNKHATSIMGTNSSLGSLRGAELALEPLGGKRGLLQEGGMEPDVDRDNGAELLLCCLSDSGYVTTHMVAEVPSQKPDRMQPEVADSRSQPERPVAFSDMTKVYPDESTGKSVLDAASMIRPLAEQPGRSSANESLRQDAEAEHVSMSPHKASLHYRQEGFHESRQDESVTQFDLEVPTTYGSAGPISNNMDAAEVASPFVLLANKDETVGSLVAKPIDKQRVPCPRLCGGSFSTGIGGIVCFHNGEIRKMWSWYEQSDSRRRTPTATVKRPSSVQFIDSPVTNSERGASESDTSVFNTKRPKQEVSYSQQECPRTLQDLEDMQYHARMAQWRSDESSGEEILVDDQSDESLDDSVSGDEEDADGFEVIPQQLYEEYFGSTQVKSPVRRESKNKPISSSSKSLDSTPGQAFVGPSSDLVPAVYISHVLDSKVLNGQCRELAQEWMLGEWYIDDEQNLDKQNYIGVKEKEANRRGSKEDEEWSWEDGTLNEWPPSENYEVPLAKEKSFESQASDTTNRIGRVKSDPMLIQLAPRRPQQKKKYGTHSDDDAVHAGAYSVRPDRQESLVFLRKLATHQRDPQIQSLMSPPDSPLLPNKMPFGRQKRSYSSNSLSKQQTPSPTSVVVEDSEAGHSTFQENRLGVYSRSEARALTRERGVRGEENVWNACVHNAEVCRKFGHLEKANVWNALAQLAENARQADNDIFNGWGGSYGGALGHDLIGNFLEYFESQGDVQMLATMVCVLSGGQRGKVSDGCSLLPASHEERYDTYLRRYADVLYGWDLMSVRAELKKHLVHRLPGTDGQDAAVDVVFWCNQCQQETDVATGICQQCRSYAFSCSICDIAVRGLFTVCAECGHGGHVRHLTEWFANHSMCPTGCGCECVLTLPTEEIHPSKNYV